ncbi:MAG: ATP-binding cassette domain-containing protein [Myxococcaceae bacterium]|nr:ATP-binding cassette domain-containing protein [Myxococcaceae bacterium]
MELATSHLVVDFGPHRALDDVSLHFPLGSQLLLYGPSGGGKTTLLKALAGLVLPTRGQVLWNGRDRLTLSRGETRDAQAHMGMVFQTDALFDTLTVERNVALPLERKGLSAAAVEEKVANALARVGLKAAAQKRPEHLSGGMRKRAGIARALVMEPWVLFADDPLAGLDPETAAGISALLLEVSHGRTLIAAMPDPHPSLPLARTLRLTPMARDVDNRSTA